MKTILRFSIALLILLVAGRVTGPPSAQSQVNTVAPYDIWTPDVIERIRNQRTLGMRIIPKVGYFEVFFNSEIGTANWADSNPPYALHTGDTIRIHGYLATPLVAGPYPALVIGHGHGGQGSAELAVAMAAMGYVALSIDGPMSGQSTGGPSDTDQAWISVEPSANYAYLYHYAYAGMRGLTLLEHLSRVPFNPFRIDSTRLGVIGASMGGLFTYYINGIDSRVKAAVAIAAAGDWHNLIFPPGSWLYHRVYYYTRDGLQSGKDAVNTISNVCTDSTVFNLLDHFDPLMYAPKQHGPLLTIIGSHDQYFVPPAINNTFDRVGSAGTNPRFTSRILINPNGEHVVLTPNNLLSDVIKILHAVNSWFRYAFENGGLPPQTPTVSMQVTGNRMVFTADAGAGSAPLRNVRLFVASQIDTQPLQPRDFAFIGLSPDPLQPGDSHRFTGSVPIATAPPSGPPITPDNVIYFAEVEDGAGYVLSSKIYYRSAQMQFCSDFVPVIEHIPGDRFPSPPLPEFNCACQR